MIKLIACDLDGTLLDNDHNVTEDNEKVIETLKEKEIPFIIATGRIYPSAAEFSKKLQLKTPIIACNGAVVKDPIKDEILFDYPVASEKMNALIDICHKYDIYYHLYSIDTVYAERNERLIKKYNEWKAADPDKSLVKTAIIKDMKEVVANNVIYKLGLYVDEEGAEEALSEMMTIEGMTSCFSLSTLVDVFSVEASKGNAVRDLGKLYGIETEHIMALGDNENDISMLESAGLSIAMKDARDKVKMSATEIGESNENSGVAIAIKKHLKLD
jgi:Cof subfamily protein (haloacid dehalogenase superfamily)